MTTETFGRYEIRGQLGKGGMATVYLAYDPQFKRNVALKVLPEVFLHNDTFRARFQREAEVIGRLEHKAIVPVYDFGEHRNQPYLVMRYMSGGSLADIFENRQALNSHQILKIVQRIASALDEAHRNGIIHRDLKPGNILFDQYGDAYLADFGIAKLGEATTTITGTTIVGTPAYMSPEQVHGKKNIDGRSDIYTLGVILYELLTGQVPYQAETPVQQMMAHVLEPVPDLRPISEGKLPPECSQVIQKALAKEPNHRHNTASELAKDLSTALQIQFEALDAVDMAAVPSAAQDSQELGTRLVGNMSTNDFLAQAAAPTEVTPASDVYQPTASGIDRNNTNYALGQQTAVAQKQATTEVEPVIITKNKVPVWAIALIGTLIGIIILGIAFFWFTAPTASLETIAYEENILSQFPLEMAEVLYVESDATDITFNDDYELPEVTYATYAFPGQVIMGYESAAGAATRDLTFESDEGDIQADSAEATVSGFSDDRLLYISIQPEEVEGFYRVNLEFLDSEGQGSTEQTDESSAENETTEQITDQNSGTTEAMAIYETEFLPNIDPILRPLFYIPEEPGVEMEIISTDTGDRLSPELYFEIYIVSTDLAEMILAELEDERGPSPRLEVLDDVSQNIFYRLPENRELIVELRGEVGEDETKVRYFIRDGR